jgi:hypothetical protein
MFYWFSGVTGDGNFYVSAVFPVGASFLPTNGDNAAAVPAGGVPFPDDFDVDQITQYFDQVKQKLEVTQHHLGDPAPERGRGCGGRRGGHDRVRICGFRARRGCGRTAA